MKATDMLSEEHRVIENVLDSMEKAVQLIDTGGLIQADFFIQVANFNKGFTDGCHHRKEEGVLFIAMNRNGVPSESGPIGVMLFEHEQGRQLTKTMRSAAERLVAGDSTAREPLMQAASGYINLLRQHIMKEDNLLFKMADQVIPLKEQDAVWEGFEKVEHEETGAGVHEKYLGLADHLAQAVRD